MIVTLENLSVLFIDLEEVNHNLPLRISNINIRDENK